MDSSPTSKFILHFWAETASLRGAERHFFMINCYSLFFFLQPPPVLTLHLKDHVFTLPHESTKTEAMLSGTQLGLFTAQEKQQAYRQSLIETHHVLSWYEQHFHLLQAEN